MGISHWLSVINVLTLKYFRIETIITALFICCCCQRGIYINLDMFVIFLE